MSVHFTLFIFIIIYITLVIFLLLLYLVLEINILHLLCMQQLSQQEDLIVWMRTAALPSFRKLYGKIEEDLEAHDEITIEIQNNYNTYSFNGRKSLILSTAGWIGGKNDLLGIAYLTVGGMCLFFAICFILMYVIKPRYVNWFEGLTVY